MPSSLRHFFIVFALTLTGVTQAAEIVPTSYSVTTDADTAFFSFTFDRQFSPSIGDEFQIWAVAGDGAYTHAVSEMAAQQPVNMQAEVAYPRLLSDAAPPVSMLVFREPGLAAGLAQIVSVTPFAVGTQDNGANDYGGWGKVQGYESFASLGSTISVNVSLATLGLGGGAFTYFFSTYGNGSGGSAEWLGLSNVNYTHPFAVVAVPEPSTYGLMILGLVATVSVARRRKQSA